jgi:hypothetical protein
MLQPQYKELIEGMSKTVQGKALQEFLIEEVAKLNDVSTINSFEETLGRKRAIEIINKIFSFLKEKKVDGSSRTSYN